MDNSKGCKNKNHAIGKVERTTKETVGMAKTILRERRCPECDNIHKTTEFSHAEIQRKYESQRQSENEMLDKIAKLREQNDGHIKLLQIIKDGIGSL